MKGLFATVVRSLLLGLERSGHEVSPHFLSLYETLKLLKLVLLLAEAGVLPMGCHFYARLLRMVVGAGLLEDFWVGFGGRLVRPIM